MNVRPCLVLISLCLAAPALAQSGWVDRVTAAYRTPAPIDTSDGLSHDAAVRVQEQVVAELRSDFGDVFGYKAGLTSKAAQERFNVDEPVLGTLLAGMIRDDGAEVSVADGVHLLIEADLLVRIGNPAINQARTREEAFEALDRVAPFLEIPDIIAKPDQPLNGPVLTAVNVGSRHGVTGPSVPLDGLAADQLAGFNVTLTRDGEPIAKSNGRALMGHPLDVVLWIAAEARQRGIALKAGDWLSLGSLTPPARPEAGQEYRAVYTGLGDTPASVHVRFIP